MPIYKHLTELIGNTPLLELTNYNNKYKLKSILTAKLEYFNPAGSIKDRVGLAMIENAEEKGLLTKNSVIIEPTSGNTGIGLAMAAAVKGYRIILTMPETMSIERRKLLKAYGAELILTEGAKGMKGAVDKAEELAKSIPFSFIPSQFTNKANPDAHRKTTAPEIWNDTDGKIDILVAGIGTGGTITGVGEFLKDKNPNIKIVGVEPFNSPLLSKGISGPHGLQGIGANFIPAILNTAVYDEIITVKNEEAYDACREIAKTDGLLVGISSGAALHAGKILAEKLENKDKIIVVIMPDGGEKYMSTPLFNE